MKTTTRPWLKVAVVGAACLLLQSLGTVRAHAAIVPNPPVFPPPSIVPGPPLIPAFPAAGNVTPPADQIADPVTIAAACGGWYRQAAYGGRWSAGSTWWEYSCGYVTSEYHNTCPGPACDAYCPYCYTETQDWSDYFYWDGSIAVFYGEAYTDSTVYDYQYDDGSPPFSYTDWWDGPMAQWYSVAPFALGVSTQGTGSGRVSSSPAGISCGFTCQANFDAGTVVILTATPDDTSVFTGWLGDCFGTGSCQVVLDRARSVTATFALNPSPRASFTVACAGLSCTFDARTSTDTGGTILDISWSFGDQSVADAGPRTTIQHTYAQTGNYSVTLTVTDSAAVASTTSQVVSVTNQPPIANLSYTCSLFTCSFDGSGSIDGDGAVQTYKWQFGDGATASGAAVQHTYAVPGGYTVSLTVTDNAGASATSSQTVTVINLHAQAYRSKGHEKVDLNWSGSAATSFDVYRNHVKIATVSSTSYTDTLSSSGSYTYQVCEAGTPTCSNPVTVTT